MGHQGYGHRTRRAKGQNIELQEKINDLRATVKSLKEKVKAARELNERLKGGGT